MKKKEKRVDILDREKLVEKVWNYHHMNHKIEKSDCILVMGSHDTRVAERGAQLFLEGWAPLIIFSGGLGRLTEGVWDKPEADIFADVAIKMGVPRDKILIENKSTNTGENILFTRQLIEQNNMDIRSFIAVHKPYMERRAYATFKRFWPEKKVLVTSPDMSFKEYCRGYGTDGITEDDVINIMVGDLQRIKIYSGKGFQIYQEIPREVWAAFEELVNMGYSRQLISEV